MNVKNVSHFEGHLCEVEKFICTTCGKEYTTEPDLERHIKIEHEKGEIPNPFYV